MENDSIPIEVDTNENVIFNKEFTLSYFSYWSHYSFKVAIINYHYLVSYLCALSYDAHMLKWTRNDWLAAVQTWKNATQMKKDIDELFSTKCRNLNKLITLIVQDEYNFFAY